MCVHALRIKIIVVCVLVVFTITDLYTQHLLLNFDFFPVGDQYAVRCSLVMMARSTDSLLSVVFLTIQTISRVSLIYCFLNLWCLWYKGYYIHYEICTFSFWWDVNWRHWHICTDILSVYHNLSKNWHERTY